MARPASIDDDELLARLGCVFREVGYEGASLAMLSEAAGLQKASLYHRFPGGKKEMAQEVLSGALNWYGANIFAPLKGDGTPADRLAAVSRALDRFYSGGRQACLLNVLSAPRGQGPFEAAIRDALRALIEAFAALARETGLPPGEAKARAERVVMLLHGSLVISRGLDTRRPFRAFLSSLQADLLAQTATATGSRR